MLYSVYQNEMDETKWLWGINRRIDIFFSIWVPCGFRRVRHLIFFNLSNIIIVSITVCLFLYSHSLCVSTLVFFLGFLAYLSLRQMRGIGNYDCHPIRKMCQPVCFYITKFIPMPLVVHGPIWQTKYAVAVPKHLGVGVDFGLCNEGDFLTWSL